LEGLTKNRSLLAPAVLRAMWSSTRGRESARKLAFQEVSLLGYLRTIEAVAAAEVVRQDTVPVQPVVTASAVGFLGTPATTAFVLGATALMTGQSTIPAAFWSEEEENLLWQFAEGAAAAFATGQINGLQLIFLATAWKKADYPSWTLVEPN